jgi:hypothetical protein
MQEVVLLALFVLGVENALSFLEKPRSLWAFLVCLSGETGERGPGL